MHPAISTPELLAIIFSFLSSQRDQFHASLVCRTWLDAGLDEIWHTIHTLKHLLGLLHPLSEIDGSLGWVFQPPSPLALNLDHGSSLQDRIALTFSPQGLDWTKFFNYSRRVRHFTTDLEEAPYHPTLWTEVETHKPSQDLLPTLKSIVFTPPATWVNASTNSGLYRDNILSTFLFLLGPSVREFRWIVTARDTPFAQREILGDLAPAAIKRRLPDLRALQLGPGGTNEIRATLRLLTGLTDLTLHTRKASSEVWEAILNISSLQVLELHSEEELDGPIEMQEFPPELGILTLKLTSLADWLHLLSKAVPSTSVFHVVGSRIIFRGEAHSEHEHPVQTFISALVACFPDLSDIHLNFVEIFDSEAPDEPREGSSLSLAGLHDLRSFNLVIPTSVHIPVDVIIAVLELSPDLLDFCLWNSCSEERQALPATRLPLIILDAFALLCPDVENIRFPLESPRVPIVTDKNVPRLDNLLRFSLDQIEAQEVDVHATGMYLASRLPGRVGGGYTGISLDQWDRVDNIAALLWDYEEIVATRLAMQGSTDGENQSLITE